MISSILFTIWLSAILIPLYSSIEEEKHTPWFVWILLSVLWIFPLFTGVNVKNNSGVYKGYVTAVEQQGALFKGWTVYLKTELESSDVDVACIERTDKELIEELQKAVDSKENVKLGYEGVWEYGIGECPGSDWKIVGLEGK